MTITWDSPEELEEYTGRLRGAAEHLSSMNRRLRRSHSHLVGRVCGLTDVDLLRQPQRWRDALMDIRHMMAALVQVGEEGGEWRGWGVNGGGGGEWRGVGVNGGGEG